MTNYVVTPSEISVNTAIQAWVMAALGLDLGHVLLAYDNGISIPLDPYVTYFSLRDKNLSTPVLTNVGTNYQSNTASEEDEYQIDCFGAAAKDFAKLLYLLARSDTTSEWFVANAGITIDATDADEPTHLPIVNDQNQYEERWTMRIRFSVPTVITTPQDFMATATINPLVNVSTLPR
jgi:hypothetical protein